MLIVGEKLNSSIPSSFKAMQERNTDFMINLINSQAEAGAEYIDVNTAMFEEKEYEYMEWAVGLIQDHSCCGIMIDSPSPKTVLRILPIISGKRPIINSVTLTERIDVLLPAAKDFGCGVVALPIAGKGIPSSVKERIENVKALIDRLTFGGVAPEHIYIDVLVSAIAMADTGGTAALETVSGVRSLGAGVHTICGLSNVSFGLPMRANINAAFLSAAVCAGLDSVIMDISDPFIRQILFASLAVSGIDEYCLGYIESVRNAKQIQK